MTPALDSRTDTQRRRARVLVAAVAAALVAQPSHAFLLGEPEIRSYLGRPLDLRIPVDGAGADSAEASCFSVLPVREAGVPAISRAGLSLEQQAGRSYLRVRSNEPVNEPASVLRVQVSCNGNGTMVRQFGLLLDPMPASLPSAPIVVAEYASQTTPAATTASVIPLPPPRESRAAPAPAARKAARHHSTARTAHARHDSPQLHARSNVAHTGGYLLKLSGPVLDLSPSRGLAESQRVALREARALLDADDYTSAMLALRDRIDVLQRRMAQLQQQATALDAPRAAPKAAVPAVALPHMSSAARPFVDASWGWILVALLGLMALFLPVWRLARRRKSAPSSVLVESPRADSAKQGVETGRFAPPPMVHAPIVKSKALANASPEVLAGDTEEAIRNARDLYNAGDRLQAAGVLRLAIEAHPERVAPWLPLFDLLMRERLATEFAELARGFRALHGASPAWKTVQRAGQQIDPGNAMYREDASAAQQAAA